MPLQRVDVTIQYKDGSDDSKPLKKLKESNSLEVVEFSTSTGIARTAFCWFVSYILRRCDKIITTLRTLKRYHINTV